MLIYQKILVQCVKMFRHLLPNKICHLKGLLCSIKMERLCAKNSEHNGHFHCRQGLNIYKNEKKHFCKKVCTEEKLPSR